MGRPLSSLKSDTKERDLLSRGFWWKPVTWYLRRQSTEKVVEQEGFYKVDWPRSGPDWTVAFFEDCWKRLDCTVQHPWTGVRFYFNKTGPYSLVWLFRTAVRSSPRNSGTGLYGPVQDRTISIYIYIIHSCRILSVTVLPSLTPDSTWLRSKSHFYGILGVIALLPKRYSWPNIVRSNT